jgi:hypothetical protein
MMWVATFFGSWPNRLGDLCQRCSVEPVARPPRFKTPGFRPPAGPYTARRAALAEISLGVPHNILNGTHNIFYVTKNIFCATKNIFCVTKNIFYVTKNIFCVTKNIFYVTKNIFCVTKNIFYVTKNIFYVTKNIFCVTKNIFCVTPKRLFLPKNRTVGGLERGKTMEKDGFRQKTRFQARRAAFWPPTRRRMAPPPSLPPILMLGRVFKIVRVVFSH